MPNLSLKCVALSIKSNLAMIVIVLFLEYQIMIAWNNFGALYKSEFAKQHEAEPSTDLEG